MAAKYLMERVSGLLSKSRINHAGTDTSLEFWVVLAPAGYLTRDLAGFTSDLACAGTWEQAVAQRYADDHAATPLPLLSATRLARMHYSHPAASKSNGDSADSMTGSTENEVSLSSPVYNVYDYNKASDFLDLDRLADQNRISTVPGINDSDRWHRNNNMKFYPLLYTEEGLKENFATFVREKVLIDMPAMPQVFSFDKPTLTYGSCFASRIRDYLAAYDSRAENLHLPEGLNNTYALLSYFKWAIGRDEGTNSTSFTKGPDGKIIQWITDDHEQAATTRDLIRTAGGFIFTLGLTEVWRNKLDGTVFWRGVPRSLYQENLHEFYSSTFADNLENLRSLVKLVRAECGNVPIVFTVSPVTLTATFRGTSTIVADCASKSTLRAAVEQLMSEQVDNIFYWPSFEIVRWLGSHLNVATFTTPLKDDKGEFTMDSRHIPDWVVRGIVQTFVETAFPKIEAINPRTAL